MEEKDIRKIVRKTISENLGPKVLPLSTIVNTREVYDTPGEYYDAYLKSAMFELNRGILMNVDRMMKLPSSFKDSEGAEYELEEASLENKSYIYAWYSISIDGLKFAISISAESTLSVYSSGTIDFSIGEFKHSESDYGPLNNYMYGEETPQAPPAI